MDRLLVKAGECLVLWWYWRGYGRGPIGHVNPGFLAPDGVRGNRDWLPRHRKRIRRDQRRDHTFAKPVGCADHHVVVIGHGVAGKQHAGDVGTNHCLHHHRQRQPLAGHAVFAPVGHRPLVPQRRPAPAHRVPQRIHPGYAQVGVLLPGKAGLGKILRSCRRPHRHPRMFPQRRIRLLDLSPQVRRYGDASDQLLRLLNVLLIDGRDQLSLDCFGCGCISAGINNEPRRDGKPCCGAFPEISSLAAHECEVVTADVFKPMNHLLLLPDPVKCLL